MNDLKRVFNGADEFLDEVIILPVGSHGAGSYNLPGGYKWTDFESVEFVGNPSAGDATIQGVSIAAKEYINNNPVSWSSKIKMSTSTTDYQVQVNATGASSFSVASLNAGTEAIVYMKGYVKKYGTRNHSKTVNVNGGANIAVNSRYEIDIASELGAEYLNRDLVVEVQLFANGRWAKSEGLDYYHNGADYTQGVGVTVKDSATIEVFTGTYTNLIRAGLNNPWDATGAVTAAPCRVKVWKVDQYLPSTQSSGDITTIWTGSAGNGVTVDWSGTGYILGQFDDIKVTDSNGYTTIVTPSELLAALDARPSSAVALQTFTETSAVVLSTSGTIISIYGINYK